jgi:hypothetical protein
LEAGSVVVVVVATGDMLAAFAVATVGVGAEGEILGGLVVVVVTTGTVAGGGFDLEPLAGLVVVVGGLVVVVGGLVVVVGGLVVVVVVVVTTGSVGAEGVAPDPEPLGGWVVGTEVANAGVADGGGGALEEAERPTTTPLAEPSAGPAVASSATAVASNPTAEMSAVPTSAVARLNRRLRSWLPRK